MKPSERDFLTERDPGDLDPTPRSARGGHEGGGHAPYLVGPLTVHRRTPSSYIYLRIPKRSAEEPKNLITPPQPSVSTRSHLGACSGAPPEGASTTEGFYINTIAPR